MTRLDLGELAAVAAEHAYPLLFATVSGAHLYGFPSRDSDVDLRGVHRLPLAEVVGLETGPETVDRTWIRAGAEIDLVTHDAGKFFRLLLNRNGYVLEQLLSPLVVTTTDAHRELVDLAPRLLTRHHAHHYRGFARNQWELAQRGGELKPVLYTLRVLLTGIHLMRAQEVFADLPLLAGAVPESPPYLADLIAAKTAAEHGPAGEQDVAADVARLLGVLDDAEAATTLPDRPDPGAQRALHDLLVRIRTDPAPPAAPPTTGT